MFLETVQIFLEKGRGQGHVFHHVPTWGPHPPYNHLFEPMKQMLGLARFASNDEAQSAVLQWLGQYKYPFNECFLDVDSNSSSFEFI